MRVGIDARMFGPKHTGIGRYVENLITNLFLIDRQNQYFLFVRRKDIKIQRYKDIKFKTVIADIPHYSLKEQFLMPYLVWREKLDLIHYPHFNVPIFFPGKFVLTVHDLIKHTSKGIETTTRNPYFYWLKYLGYKLVFWLAVKRAKLIFVPSKTVALQLTKAYKIPENKIKVTYEGVENKLKVNPPAGGEKLKVKEILEKYKIKKPFLLYVGNVYPHKNIERLIEAVRLVNSYRLLVISEDEKKLETSNWTLITLVIVCARDVFLERLERKVKDIGAEKFIKLVGYVSDEELKILYQNAEAFVFPSLSEGFGLPGLEAMANGLPVLASDIPVFKEVYGQAAVYFNPAKPEDIAQKINKFLTDPKLQKKLKTRGLELVRGYSWKRMAKETLNGYQAV